MTPIEDRKTDHLRLALHEDVQAPHVRSGFDGYYFIHQALPELDLAEIDLSTTFLGKPVASPLLISSMTGGLEQGRTINRNLAIAAQRKGLAMGLGSQRIVIEHPESLESFQVRDVAPGILLLGNLGAVQLNYGFDVATCRRLVELTGVDALILHLNPLQEAVQHEGNTNFRGLLARIDELCRELGVPVLAKEVGSGIAPDTARRLAEAGVAAIDVAGAGGTSWARIEGKRAAGTLGESFADWGLPTSEALASCRAALPALPLVASGGIRSGLDAAKAIALGADMVGLALPFLEAATRSVSEVEAVIDRLNSELRTAMFCLGCPTIAALRLCDRLRRRIP